MSRDSYGDSDCRVCCHRVNKHYCQRSAVVVSCHSIQLALTNISGCGRPETGTTPELEEAILDTIEEDPQIVPGILYPGRLMSHRWLIHTMTHNNNFLSNTLLTDEAEFSRDTIMNFYNNHF